MRQQLEILFSNTEYDQTQMCDVTGDVKRRRNRIRVLEHQVRLNESSAQQERRGDVTAR